MEPEMKIKEIEFKQATCSNRDYQVKEDELSSELASKARKWKVLKESLETAIGNSILN